MLRRILLAATVCASCTTNEPSSQVTQAVTTSQSAAKILSDLRAQFVLHYETPPPPETAMNDDTPTSRNTPVFVASDVEKVQQTGPRLSPTLKSGESPVMLPDRAAGAIELSSGAATVRVSLVGASSNALAELGDGYIVYVNGAPGGGHVLHLATKEGVEDFVTFARAPQDAGVQYSVELVSGVAGLRLVDNTLELLDGGGAPRLRVRPPYLVDSTGKGVSASLAVSGCSLSTDPRAPWGQAVTAPGSNKCTVHVSWNNGDLTFPAVLDPSWSSTGSMTQARADHTLTLLDDGHVLAACGIKSGTLPGADLYDATSGTWAATGNPKKKRSEHVAVKLTNGKVLMAGGINGSTVLKVAELYNPATGTWSNTGSMAAARRAFIGEILSNGKVLVSGGYSPSVLASAELYDPTAATWANTGTMATARAVHRSSVIANNNVMVTGGIGTGSVYQSGAEIYSHSAGTWSTGGTMTTARANHAQISLAFDGRVIVGGGYTGTATTTSVDRWDPTTNTWSGGPALLNGRMKMGAALAGGAQVLFAAGISGTTTLSSSELLQNYPPAMQTRPTLVTARSNFPLVRLADGRALAAGGLQGSTYLSAAEIYDSSEPASGDVVPEQNSPPTLSMEWDLEDPLGAYDLNTAPSRRP